MMLGGPIYIYFDDSVCCFDIVLVMFITDIASHVVKMNRKKHLMLRGGCGYERSSFYILYTFRINDSHVYTQFFIYTVVYASL